MKKLETFTADPIISCENYVSTSNINNLELFSRITKKLKISLLVIEDLDIENRNNLISSAATEDYFLTSLTNICHNVMNEERNLVDLKQIVRDEIISKHFNLRVIISRKTLEEDSIEKLKKKLSEIREKYEIIAVKSNDIKVLKWAAHDRRVDYIVVDLLSEQIPIDKALCSLMKQHKKSFELILSPLLLKDSKRMSVAIRIGKKIFKLINSTNTPFILTMKPDSCFHMRNGIQIRYLAELIDIPFNKSKNCVFDDQLSISLRNSLKLEDSHVVEGIREVA
ncbi:MAG: hypothetical protein KGD64_08400 [Candidatus Heimdallarchaeota archaeon]|nr:hypothetical protein [Candidatus Heimdallarchaeota archaeon]